MGCFIVIDLWLVFNKAVLKDCQYFFVQLRSVVMHGFGVAK